MTELDYDAKLAELDRLLNDPDSAMDPSKIWLLLAEVARHDPSVTPAAPSGLAAHGP